MSENKNTPQEIDLIELFTNIGKWFGKWIHIIFYGILFFFLRNIYLFILCLIVGLVFTLLVHNTTKKFYKCELIGYSHTISNAEVIQFVNNWNYANAFDNESVKKIKDIKATYLLDLNKDGKWDVVEETEQDVVTDTVILNRRSYGNFCIQLQVYDTTILQTLSTRLFEYMGSNKRVKEMNKIRIQQQKELLPAIKKEFTDLDSLKNVEYFTQNKAVREKEGSLLIWNEKEVKLYHKDLLDLYQKKQAVERDLYLYPDPFEIIQDFSAPRTAENSLINILFRIEKISLLVGFIIILLYDQRRRIFNLIKHSHQIKD
jgi:hypothetical protein